MRDTHGPQDEPPTTKVQSQRTRVPKIWPLLMAAVLLFWNLSYTPFWNPDEGRYSSSSLEMAGLLRGSAADWVTPRLNTIPRLNKPPLVYWAAGSFFRVFGPSEWAGRLVPALAALGVLLVLYQLAGRAFGAQAGIFSALIWATSLLPWALGRTLNTDMLLTCGITLSLWGLWLLLEPDAPSQRWIAALWCGIGLGIALLAKGPVGLAMPLGIAFVWRLWATGLKGAFSHVPWTPLGAALILTTLMALPWYRAVEARHPGFLSHFLVGENLHRFAGATTNDHAAAPLWYYLPVLLLGLMPWVGFLPAFSSKKFSNATATATFLENRTRLFCLVWAVLIVGFFSVSSTKLVSYVLPAFPALSVLIGDVLSRRDNPSLRRVALGLTLFINAIILVAVSIALLNNQLLPQAEALPWVVGIALILVTGSAGLIWASRQSLAQMVLAQGVFAVALYAVLMGGAAHVAPYRDPSALLRQFRSQLRPDDRMVLFNVFPPTAIFYLGRPVEVYGFNNTSGLDEDALKASRFFLKSTGTDRAADLAIILADSRRTFALVKWGRKAIALPPNAHIWARNNDFQLVCNRPAPSGWKWDFVAPVQQQRYGTNKTG